ncbi:cyclin-domain-containing protein [Zychaea mexicana]|uniref:cyclin-domain-containing protein n=1 Tax=Zychaea mexicana TaxID=64656 RepID=UPI0022FEC019|nr:cyclin-domain-containing protein [Zychaea mexicana]KAI9493069.1 cyclin-domain-containing protein [Zychaea mexicana]
MTHNNPLPHFDLANHPPPETINMITGLLERITKTNDKLQASNGSADKQYTAFHSRSVPTIGIHAYLSRILKYCPCTNECFLSLLVYFDRMSRNSSCLRITSFNIHRLVISGIMVASKFFSDIFFTNTRYAKVVGGLPVAELNALELEFLHLNGYNLNVPIEELQQYGDQLLLHWVREEERRRELQWRRKEATGDDERMAMVAMRRSLSGSNSSDSSNSSDIIKTQPSSTIITSSSSSSSSSSHNPRTALAGEVKMNSKQHRRLSFQKEEGAESDPFCRQSRASKVAHENRATRVTYKSTTTSTSVPSRYSTSMTPPGTDYHKFPSSQTLDGVPVTAKEFSQHHHQRHSWHIDHHHHRLPTPPYSAVIHP